MKRLFAIGQAVICINDDFSWARKYYPEIKVFPLFGQRYIVRGYFDIDRPAIVLREMSNPSVMYHDGVRREAGFYDKRFISAPLPDAIQVSKMISKSKEKEKVSC